MSAASWSQYDLAYFSPLKMGVVGIYRKDNLSVE